MQVQEVECRDRVGHVHYADNRCPFYSHDQRDCKLLLNTSNMWDMYQKKSDSKNFFKTLGMGDLRVPSVLDFAGESPLCQCL